ncbi:hypothetical protein [Streptomyces sp. KMM 9044]|uniref:hypothetical protein n=1 Tax=Streptomyces sp. KMM 9044 TaxID=2744474 RepID=UPI0021510670|nr:hypothetical protein [Streptomyces sp. KMM 9044]WAX77760.1 hypothetical protein HUV60_008820 [Streptomyces sp. KMM 9044]
MPSSAAVRSADGAADVRGLAPYPSRPAALLPGHDVWHLTHGFAFVADSAAQFGERSRAMFSGLGRARPACICDAL